MLPCLKPSLAEKVPTNGASLQDTGDTRLSSADEGTFQEMSPPENETF